MPKGYPDRAVMIVAKDAEEAELKSLAYESIKVIVDGGGSILVMDINMSLSTVGYKLTVERIGMYH